MIDLHNHILPALDDGAVDIDESLEIARQFVSEGVSTVAATPHLNLSSTAPVHYGAVAHALEGVRDALGRENIPLEVVQGQEVYLVPDVLPALEAGEVYTLGGSRSVLIELPFDIRPIYLDDLVFGIQLAGFTLILAHPERYRFVQRDLSSVEPLVDRGVLLQATAPGLMGEYGATVQRTAEGLLQGGLYALAASDRHHPGPLRSLSLMHDRIAALTSADMANLLLRENPRRVLTGVPVIEPERTKIPRKGNILDRLRSRMS